MTISRHLGAIMRQQPKPWEKIYTTEKYLFLGAMRTVAFIISRKGADKNALTATRGAVRESGKLIVHLSVDDLCKMMDMKDNTDEPNAFCLIFLMRC